MIVLLIVGAVLILSVIFDIPIYAIILGVVGLFIAGLVISVVDMKHQLKIAEGVLRARQTEEIAVYKKRTEHTGYSLSRGERRDHYEYKDVLDHYECVFKVEYKDGSKGELKCRKDSVLYAELSKK